MASALSFREAEEHLLGLELFGMRFGLDRTHKLMTALGMPQRSFDSIHVVGSNGKSSTVRFLAAILERHGLRTGAYTSPHLRSFRERIEVDERPISEDAFAAAVSRAVRAARLVDRTAAADDHVTQFEALTAAAFSELARRKVEVAVVEAGLGGRFDATNVISSKVQVLTTVGLEHTRWLGPTLEDIAGEKLAVVEDGGVLVTGDLVEGVREVAEGVMRERGARLVSPARGPAPDGLPGAYQRRNFELAAAAAEAFLGRSLDRDAVESAAAETRVPGRLDLVADRPITLLDGAHNPGGAIALAEALPEVLELRRPRVGVIAVLDDKDATGMLAALLPEFDHIVYTRSAHPRSLSPATLETLAEKLASRTEVAVEGHSNLSRAALPVDATERSERPAGPSSETVGDPAQALERARRLAGTDGAVVATGSIYLIADLVRERTGARASTL
jgi:dihydrofolate synthase / folylpolyglutamate synthase